MDGLSQRAASAGCDVAEAEIQIRHAVWLTGICGLLVWLPVIRRIPHGCAMQFLVGLPCPGCGITTGLVALLRGRWTEAWQANPAAGLVLLGMLRLAVAHAAALFRAGQMAVWAERARRAITAACCGGLGLVWVVRLLGRV